MRLSTSATGIGFANADMMVQSASKSVKNSLVHTEPQYRSSRFCFNLGSGMKAFRNMINVFLDRRLSLCYYVLRHKTPQVKRFREGHSEWFGEPDDKTVDSHFGLGRGQNDHAANSPITARKVGSPQTGAKGRNA